MSVCVHECVCVLCNYLFLLTTNHLHTHPEAFALATSVFQFHFLSHIIKLERSLKRLHPHPTPCLPPTNPHVCFYSFTAHTKCNHKLQKTFDPIGWRMKTPGR